ncbi:hypothetical protein [Enterococcus villorum]|uniref:hypothetical protein n=1 Tax=Enterococcus villorum TaxID=112904 RepID=UPI0019D3A2DD|nr:hypothetical protein [Enterococcus villorum]
MAFSYGLFRCLHTRLAFTYRDIEQQPIDSFRMNGEGKLWGKSFLSYRDMII